MTGKRKKRRNGDYEAWWSVVKGSITVEEGSKNE